MEENPRESVDDWLFLSLSEVPDLPFEDLDLDLGFNLVIFIFPTRQPLFHSFAATERLGGVLIMCEISKT